MIVFEKYLIFFFIVLSGVLSGQPLTFYENGHEILHYHDSKSLHTDVGDVWKDEDGRLWIVNIGSLYCFDGYDFERYQPDESSMMNDARDQFHQVIKDDFDNLWLSSNQAGVLKYDASDHTFQRFRINENSFTDFRSSGIAIDSLRNIWMAYTRGLLRLNNNDSTTLQVVEPKSLAASLAPLIDSMSLYEKELASITKISNNQALQQSFSISNDQDLVIIGQGEILKTYNYNLPIFDYVDKGWITDDKGKIVWKMNIENSYNAGGLIDVRINTDFIKLPKGDYILHYKTDDHYSYDDWIHAGRQGATGPSKRLSPPSVPEWWGIQVFTVSKEEKKSIANRIAKYEQSRDLTSSHTGIFQDVTGRIWVFGRALEELKVKSNGSFECIKHADWNLSNKNSSWNQILGLEDKDEDNFWMFIGVVDEDGEQHLKLGIFNKTRKNFTEIKTDLPVGFRYWTIKQDHKNNLWIGGYYDSGLYRLSPPFHDISSNRKANLMRFDLAKSGKKIWRIKTMEMDDYNNLWIGTHQQGLYKINLEPLPFNYVDLSQHPEMTGKQLTSIKEDQYGNYWLTTSPFSLLQYKRSTGELKAYHNSFNGIQFDYIAYTTELQNGNLLFQTEDDLIEYDVENDQATMRHVKGVSMTSQVKTRISFCKGFIYNDSLVYIPGYLINTNDWSIDKALKNYVDGSRWSALKSKKGGLWISRSWGENLRLDFVKDRVDTLEAQMSFAYTLDLLEDNEDNLWIANNFNTKKMERGSRATEFYTVSKGLRKPNYVAKIFQHGMNIWQFTSLGTSVIDLETNSFENPGKLGELAILDAYKNDSGEFVMMSQEGIYIFDPDKVKRDQIAPKTIIKSVAIENKNRTEVVDQIKDSQPLQFNYNQNDISIEYVGVQFNNPAKTTYSYQLLGSSNKWQDVNTDRTARFLNLPPKNYTFSVKAANENGIWSEPVVVQFKIVPPWWNNWISRTMYVLVGVLLLSTIIKSRLDKLRKERNDKKAFAEALIKAQEEERKRIASDLHDGIGQSLLLIKKQLEATSEVTVENHNLIGQTLDEVRAISHDLHPFQLEKFGLSAAISEMLNKIEKSTDLFMTSDIQEIQSDRLSDNAQINIYRTIQEALSNIVKHAEASAAKVLLKSNRDTLFIVIQDNGKGFDHELTIVTSKSLGLRTMNERILSIGGSFSLGKGTSGGVIIDIEVPYTNEI